MNVTQELEDWEDSRNMNRKRQWFTIDDALQQLALHKPVQRRYLQQLKNSRNNMTTNVSHGDHVTSFDGSNQIPESTSDTANVDDTVPLTNANTLTEPASSNNSVATTATTIQQSTSQTAAAI